MNIKIKDSQLSTFLYVTFSLIAVLIIFNETICELIIRAYTKNLAILPFDFVVSTFDKITYFLLFGYFILSLVYIIHAEKSNTNNLFHRIFPGFFCLVFPLLFQIIILRYQYLFLWEDAGHYVSIGMNLFSGYGLSSSISGTLGSIYWPYLPFPIYQNCHYLFSIFFGLFWEIFHSLKGIMLSIVIIESINCFLIYKISKKIFKSVFYSIGISFLYFSIVLYIIPQRENLQPIYDLPFSTLVLLLVYFLNDESLSFKKASSLGLILGIGVLVKITSFFVLIVLILSVLLYFPKSLKIRIKTSCFIIAGFLFFFIPYQIYCLQSKGEVFPSKYTSPFYSLNYILKDNKSRTIMFYNQNKNSIHVKEAKISKLNVIEEVPMVKSPKDDEVVGRRPKFRWSKVEGASGYEVEITTDGGEKKEEYYSYKTTLETNYDFQETQLRWRVRAKKDTVTGKWSSWAYFTPKDTLEQTYIISPIGDKIVGQRPRFHWTKVKGASSYVIEVTTDGGRKIEEYYSKKTNRKTRNALPTTRLRWRVKAKKDTATGKWSSWAYFIPKKPMIMRGNPKNIINIFYYSRLFPYLIIMLFSIFLFALHIIFKRKTPINLNLYFSFVFILVYSILILWSKHFSKVLVRHFYTQVALSFIIILFVLDNFSIKKNIHFFKLNKKRIPINKSMLYIIIFVISTATLWNNVQENCFFIYDKWKYKNQIHGGYEEKNISNLVKWIKWNSKKDDLIAFQYDNVGEIHVLTERPFVIFSKRFNYRKLIKFLKYYKPRYIILHNENVNRTPFKFNETIENACKDLNYTSLDIIDRHKIWHLEKDKIER